jgi:hypothetical protein
MHPHVSDILELNNSFLAAIRRGRDTTLSIAGTRTSLGIFSTINTLPETAVSMLSQSFHSLCYQAKIQNINKRALDLDEEQWILHYWLFIKHSATVMDEQEFRLVTGLDEKIKLQISKKSIATIQHDWMPYTCFEPRFPLACWRNILRIKTTPGTRLLTGMYAVADVSKKLGAVA